MNNEIVENINVFINNAFIYNDIRKQLQKNSLKLRKAIMKEKITDYIPYSFGYLYQLCNYDKIKFFQTLPEILRNNPILALLYTSYATNVEQSYFANKMNCQIIPSEFTKDITYICQCTILQNIKYCMIYIDKNIIPAYQIYDNFDTNIQQFLHTIHDKYVDDLFQQHSKNSNKLIKLFLGFYPFLNAQHINYILYTISKLNKLLYHNSILLILDKIKQRIQKDKIDINIKLFNNVQSKILLKELNN